MRYLSYLLLCVIVTGCSSKYLGESNKNYWNESCEITEKSCSYKFGDFDIEYQVSQHGSNKYHFSGEVLWNNYKLSGIYENIKKLRMTFIFMDERKVVHVEDIYLSGDRDKPQKFDVEIHENLDIKYSNPMEYIYTITE